MNSWQTHIFLRDQTCSLYFIINFFRACLLGLARVLISGDDNW